MQRNILVTTVVVLLSVVLYPVVLISLRLPILIMRGVTTPAMITGEGKMGFALGSQSIYTDLPPYVWPGSRTAYDAKVGDAIDLTYDPVDPARFSPGLPGTILEEYLGIFLVRVVLSSPLFTLLWWLLTEKGAKRK